MQFHEIALAVPLLALSLAAPLRRRWWPAATWAAPPWLLVTHLVDDGRKVDGYLVARRTS